MPIGRLSFYITEVQGDPVRSGRENCASSEVLDLQRNTVPGRDVGVLSFIPGLCSGYRERYVQMLGSQRDKLAKKIVLSLFTLMAELPLVQGGDTPGKGDISWLARR